jgi:hypothetical protein
LQFVASLPTLKTLPVNLPLIPGLLDHDAPDIRRAIRPDRTRRDHLGLLDHQAEVPKPFMRTIGAVCRKPVRHGKALVDLDQRADSCFAILTLASNGNCIRLRAASCV